MLGGLGPLLKFVDVCKEYQARSGLFGGRSQVIRAVDGVTLSIEEGEACGLVGESGSGKSTLARLVMLIDRLTSGSIVFDGRDLTSATRTVERWYRAQSQMVMQDPFTSLDPRMRVEEIVAEPLISNTAMSRADRKRAAHAMLERVGLRSDAARQFPHEFSGGQRQRIAIARALVVKPRLLVLDEPVSSLDVSIRSQILNLLRDLQQQFAVTYLIISHDLATVRNLCTHTAVMQHGRLVEHGETEIVLRNPQDPYTKVLLDAIPDPFGAFHPAVQA